MTVTPPKVSSRIFTLKPRVRWTIWHTEFIGDLGLVTCCPFGGGNVGQSMPWYEECFVSVMSLSGVLAMRFW